MSDGTSLHEALEQVLAEEFHPFPRIHEREKWESLSPRIRDAYVTRAAALTPQQWPVLPASRYLDFARNGNRSVYQDIYFARRKNLTTLLLAECCEDTGRFLDAIVDAVWLICEESSWCVPAHIGQYPPGVGLPDTAFHVVDLFAAETAALLSWVHELIGPRLDTVSPLVNPRIEREVRLRCLDPCLERDDFHWLGFDGKRVNNWTPWINSNWLTCILLLENDPQRRRTAVAKSLQSVDCFLGPYPEDGGCDEGPSYWARAGASLFEWTERLHVATSGRFSPFQIPLVGDIGRYISRVHIDEDRYVNFADAPAVVRLPGGLIERYGRRIGDDELQAFGRWIAERDGERLPDSGTSGSTPRVLAELFGIEPDASGGDGGKPSLTAVPAFPRESWLPAIQVMTARDEAGSSDGYFVAAKGGHNKESHNHNDVGSFVVYRDGKPLLIDIGVETYTRKTFSPERYTIWTMQSRYHNLLPMFDGVMQAPGKDYAAAECAFAAC